MPCVVDGMAEWTGEGRTGTGMVGTREAADRPGRAVSRQIIIVTGVVSVVHTGLSTTCTDRPFCVL